MKKKLNDDLRMEPGEVVRFYCNSCLTEYEITLEPKATEGVDAGEAKYVERCPFCGIREIEAC